jgi:hypothetical protein
MKIPPGLIAGTLGTHAGLAVLLACAPLTILVHAAEQPAAPAAERSGFRFSLLPRSLQRQPSLDFHVVTELTPEGSKLAPPTATAPVYYIAQPGQFVQMGDNTPAGEHPPDLARLTRAMETALASSGYTPASPATPLPALAIVFNYGSFARFSTDLHDAQDDMVLADAGAADGPLLRSDNRSTDSLLPIVLSHQRERDEVLRRAALVGGEKFSRNLAKALIEEAKYQSAGDGELGLGSVKVASPFHLFMNANPELMARVEDSFNDCYFIIASAFDYTAMRKGQRVLLWRTKMTVNASGISMAESLPPLAIAAGPYLGREMPDAVTISRKISRGGSVKLDELRVIESGVSIPGDAPPPSEPSKDRNK